MELVISNIHKINEEISKTGTDCSSVMQFCMYVMYCIPIAINKVETREVKFKSIELNNLLTKTEKGEIKKLVKDEIERRLV